MERERERRKHSKGKILDKEKHYEKKKNDPK